MKPVIPREAIEKYFADFRAENLWLIIIGGLALLAGILLWFFAKSDALKGLATPLLVYALLAGGAGFNNMKSEKALRVRANYNLDMHPEKLRSEETARLQEMNKNFTILIWICSSIIVAGVIISYVLRKKNQLYYSSMAASLALCAGLLMLFAMLMKNTNIDYLGHVGRG